MAECLVRLAGFSAATADAKLAAARAAEPTSRPTRPPGSMGGRRRARARGRAPEALDAWLRRRGAPTTSPCAGRGACLSDGGDRDRAEPFLSFETAGDHPDLLWASPSMRCRGRRRRRGRAGAGAVIAGRARPAPRPRRCWRRWGGGAGEEPPAADAGDSAAEAEQAAARRRGHRWRRSLAAVARGTPPRPGLRSRLAVALDNPRSEAASIDDAAEPVDRGANVEDGGRGRGSSRPSGRPRTSRRPRCSTSLDQTTPCRVEPEPEPEPDLNRIRAVEPSRSREPEPEPHRRPGGARLAEDAEPEIATAADHRRAAAAAPESGAAVPGVGAAGPPAAAPWPQSMRIEWLERATHATTAVREQRLDVMYELADALDRTGDRARALDVLRRPRLRRGLVSATYRSAWRRCAARSGRAAHVMPLLLAAFFLEIGFVLLVVPWSLLLGPQLLLAVRGRRSTRCSRATTSAAPSPALASSTSWLRSVRLPSCSRVARARVTPPVPPAGPPRDAGRLPDHRPPAAAGADRRHGRARGVGGARRCASGPGARAGSRGGPLTGSSAAASRPCAARARACS